jgi:hypothetical protein
MKKLFIVFLVLGLIGCDQNSTNKQSSSEELAEMTINESYNLEPLREFYNQPYNTPGYYLINIELNECIKDFAFIQDQQDYELKYSNGETCLIGKPVEDPAYNFLINKEIYYSNGTRRMLEMHENEKGEIEYSAQYFDINGNKCFMNIPEEYADFATSEVEVVIVPYPNCSIFKISFFKQRNKLWNLVREVFFNQDLDGNWKKDFYSCINYFDDKPESYGGDYQTTYYGGDIKCKSQNIIKNNIETDLSNTCSSPSKYKLANFLSKYGDWDYDKYKNSSDDLSRLLYEQRYTNLELSIGDWEVDMKAKRYRTPGEISTLCEEYLKDRIHFNKY